MADTPDAHDQPPQDAASSDSTPPRGLLGRFLDAFAAPEPVQGGTPEAASGHPAHHDLGNLRRLKVEDVAIPKVEIEAVPSNITLDALIKAFRDSGFSRLPVYKGTLDSPQGLIHLKDLALQHAFSEPKPRFNLRKLLRPLLYAPPSMPIGVLLQKMQSQRIHMALVIDEYGGVDGLVTIEDLIEQVVGEIADEHDDEESAPWTEEKPGQYLVQARAPLDEFETRIGRKLAEDAVTEDIDTLGGLVVVLAGRVPVRGEVVPIGHGIEAEVVDADLRRVKRLRIRLAGVEG